MELTHLIWLLLVVFMLHDLEEIITVENWLFRHRALLVKRLPSPWARWLGPSLSMTTAQFAVAVTCIFVILSAAVLLAATTLSQGTFLPVYLVCLHTLFLHVFTHLGISFRVRGYSPGVVTAVALILPYSLYTYFRLFEAGLINWSLVAGTLPFVLLVIPVLHAAHKLGMALSKPPA